MPGARSALDIVLGGIHQADTGWGSTVGEASGRASDLIGRSGLEVRQLPDRVGLELSGVVDLSSRHEFEQSLMSLVSRGSDVYLDLSRLVFCDVAAAAVLVTAAQSLPAGRRLVLRRPPETLRRTLELFWPRVPRMEMAA